MCRTVRQVTGEKPLGEGRVWQRSGVATAHCGTVFTVLGRKGREIPCHAFFLLDGPYWHREKKPGILRK